MSDAESSDLSSISSDETDSNSDSTETDSDASYSDFEDSFNERFVIPQPNFYELIYQQNFPFHNTFMDYILKNLKSAEVYQNLIQTCKYFFHKNPIVFIAEAYNSVDDDAWNMRLKFKDISCKVWITHKIEVQPESRRKNDFIKNIIPKIYKSDIKKLYLNEHRISLNELIFLCSSRCRKILLSEVKFEKNDDGIDITLEGIIEVLPKLKYFDYNFKKAAKNFVSSKTIENLMKIQHFSKFTHLTLIRISPTFISKSFYNFLKGNKNTKFYFEFANKKTPKNWKVYLQNIVDDIIKTKNREYKMPWIDFSGMKNYEKFQDFWHQSRYEQ